MRDKPVKVEVDHPLAGMWISEDEDSNAAFTISIDEQNFEFPVSVDWTERFLISAKWNGRATRSVLSPICLRQTTPPEMSSRFDMTGRPTSSLRSTRFGRRRTLSPVKSLRRGEHPRVVHHQNPRFVAPAHRPRNHCDSLRSEAGTLNFER
jgi:hypothetical protein